MKHKLVFILMLLPMFGMAQSRFDSYFISPLQGVSGEGYQGMDIWGDYLVSCQNKGVATVYRFDGTRMTKLGDSFLLGSYNVNNHSNVASFGTTFYNKHDKLPLLYVSQAQKKMIGGRKDVLYVERINPDTHISQLVQTICFNDMNHNFGYALQWVVDREHHFLYGYGNTINNSDVRNKHRIIKFHIPSLRDTLVVLNESDALENYLLEDTFKEP